MMAINQSRLIFELHRAAVVATFTGCIFVILYFPPTLVEWVLSWHFSVQAVCGALGDSASYLALFVLGFRRQAAGVYVLARLLEITLLKGHLIAMANLIWLTDSVPTIYCAILLSKIVFFSDEDPQRRFGLKLS